MANPNRSQRRTVCDSPEALRAFAASLAREVGPCGVIALDGPLGAGKTEFVKGLAEGLGSRDIPTSPTFAIAHEYQTPGGPLCHFDFYRMETEAELETCGFEDCLGCGLVAAEWASKFPGWLPPGTVWVRLEILPDGSRAVSVNHPGGQSV